MEKPEIPELKTTSHQSYIFILNFFKSLTTEEIIQKEKYYTTKTEHLLNTNCQEKLYENIKIDKIP